MGAAICADAELAICSAPWRSMPSRHSSRFGEACIRAWRYVSSCLFSRLDDQQREVEARRSGQAPTQQQLVVCRVVRLVARWGSSANYNTHRTSAVHVRATVAHSLLAVCRFVASSAANFRKTWAWSSGHGASINRIGRLELQSCKPPRGGRSRWLALPAGGLHHVSRATPCPLSRHGAAYPGDPQRRPGVNTHFINITHTEPFWLT